MRNLLLGLVLANLFLLAWQFWVDPSPVKLTDAPADAQGGGLALFRSRNTELKSPEGPAVAAVEGCLQVGPYPDDAAARQAR